MSLFNKSARTNSAQQDTSLRPITFRFGADISLEKTCDALKKMDSESFKVVKDYHEIYMVMNKTEFTLTFIEDFGKTHLTILAYNEKHPLRIKKYLKKLTGHIREELSSIIE